MNRIRFSILSASLATLIFGGCSRPVEPKATEVGISTNLSLKEDQGTNSHSAVSAPKSGDLNAPLNEETSRMLDQKQIADVAKKLAEGLHVTNKSEFKIELKDNLAIVEWPKDTTSTKPVTGSRFQMKAIFDRSNGKLLEVIAP